MDPKVIVHNFKDTSTATNQNRAVAGAPLNPSQLALIPDDAEVKKWWRMQIDGTLLEWLLDNLDPKLVIRSQKLMLASMKMIPAGTLPDDDAYLAQRAGYGHGIDTWLKVKDRVMSGVWFQRPDGRWQCAALTEAIIVAMRHRKGPAGHPKARRTQTDDGDIPF
jgi:hypothetical protein